MNHYLSVFGQQVVSVRPSRLWDYIWCESRTDIRGRETKDAYSFGLLYDVDKSLNNIVYKFSSKFASSFIARLVLSFLLKTDYL